MSDNSLGLIKLRLSALGTIALVISASTLFFAIILSFVGIGLLGMVGFVVFFNIIQWLFAPKLINRMYKTKEVTKRDDPQLYGIVERLSRRMELKMPKVMEAKLPIANAFAYGSPLTGNLVAVTTGLRKELNEGEVESVIGHELGHLKNKDVQAMVFLSVLPSIFYFIGFSLMLSSMFRGGLGGRGSGGGAGGMIVIGLLSMIMYWLLTILVLGYSRTREYYADRRSVMVVDDGGKKLRSALAKIVASSGRFKISKKDHGAMKFDGFKALFISDPDRSTRDEVSLHRAKLIYDEQLVNKIISRKLTFSDRLVELLSTHPNMVKRLRALQEL